jgi:hypothetical protein
MSGTMLLDAALGHAARGWPVFPLHWPCRDDGVTYCSCGSPVCRRLGEHPNLLLAPGGWRDATTDPASIERWWGGGPHNIAIPTGARSGIIVIDIDRRSGGATALARLERRHGPLPATARFLAGGREQFLFMHPRRPIPRASRHIAAGIEVLADGDYVVAPPSLRADGQPCVLSAPPDSDGVLVASLPLWIVGLICQPQRFPIPPELPEALRRLDREGAADEHRNWCVARLSGLLLHRGLDPFWTLVLVRDWNAAHCRPPLPDTEVVGLVEDVFERFPMRYRKRLLQRATDQFGERARWPQALLGDGVVSQSIAETSPGRDAANDIPSSLAAEMPEGAAANASEDVDAVDGLL